MTYVFPHSFHNAKERENCSLGLSNLSPHMPANQHRLTTQQKRARKQQLMWIFAYGMFVFADMSLLRDDSHPNNVHPDAVDTAGRRRGHGS